MKVKTVVMAGVAGSLFVGAANAAYMGISWDLYAVDGNGVAGLENTETWRLYVEFDNMDDQLTGMGGSFDQPLHVWSDDGTFYQDAFGGDTDHNAAFEVAFPSLHYDTYITIGSTDSGTNGPTSLAGNWPGFGPSELFVDDAGWFRNPDDPVTYAGDDYRVLWGQFTIYKGKHLAGDLKMSMTLDGNGETVLDSFVIPSPAAMALLGLAGLVGRRRR